ncbi:unnamed protein product, partial [Gongylonema pulchrum]|uniref:Ncstrn_small domain-containing protein n=1 Tax=Gongylonema pulchrum TaxID=637853 RepID=A0A183EFY6_9BILA
MGRTKLDADNRKLSQDYLLEQISCFSATEEGNEGIVVYADSEDKLIEEITDQHFSADIIVALDIFLLNGKTIKALKNDRVRGVLLFYNASATDGKMSARFSEDAACPNEQF